MTMTPELRAFLLEQPGRCEHCLAHIATQGHNGGCLATAERLRDQGMARAENAHPSESDAIDAAIRQVCTERVEWSANDLRPLLNGITGGIVGARVNAAARRKWMTRVGYEPSTEPGTHGHPVAVWRSNLTGTKAA